MILRDWHTPANLMEVSKFNSTNQNMCSDTAGLTKESFWIENYAAKHTYARIEVYKNIFGCSNSDSNILVSNCPEKSIRSTLEEDCSTSVMGFHDD